jgi:hypothetical protein
MAEPCDPVWGRMSVTARALFHVKPLPPYHHVPSVDKHSKRIVHESSAHLIKSLPEPSQTPGYNLPRTPTYGNDFSPCHTGNAERALPRPPLLGVLLEPRKKSLIRYDQRHEWDLVTRRLFVKETKPLSAGVEYLGFGAGRLVPKFEQKDSEFAGVPVSGKTLIRDITVEGWARIVDVFAAWPFKPAV